MQPEGRRRGATGARPDDARPARAVSARLGPAPPLLLAAAYALLLAAWVFGNPPFASPDEPAHYLRSLGIARGELVGEPAELPVGAPPPGLSEEIHRAQLAWMSQFTTVVEVPPNLAPSAWYGGCLAAAPTRPATCLDEAEPPREASLHLTHVGRYPPLPYALPSLAMLPAGDALTANRLGRTAAATTCFALLALSIALLWGRDGSRLSLLGLTVAVTPMAVFLCATMNPNGLEIAAGIAFLSGMIRLARETRPPTWVWGAAGGAAVVLALSRTPGALWIALGAALLVGLRGARETLLLVRRTPAPAAAAAASAALAVGATFAWEATYGSRAEVGLSPVRESLEAAWGWLPSILEQQVGVFASLDLPMPAPAYTAWYAIVVALVVAAALSAPLRQRLVVAAALLAAVVVPVLFWAAILRHSLFPPQGRYFLPVAAALPLLAGEALYRNRARLQPATAYALAAGVTLVAAATQFIGWLTNARRWAVGSEGPWWFPATPDWSPPATWWPWLLAAAAGSALLAAPFVLRPAAGRPAGAPARAAPPTAAPRSRS
jgi:hypothetical protein